MASTYDSDFSFHEQLWFFYSENRGKIRSRYNDLTRKFLSYNDKDENKNAFLRKPQFEALEMYVFIKEFMNHAQVYELFDDWRNKRNRFSEASYYSNGQLRLGDALTEKQTDVLFKQMKKYRESYPNYIYALTMGLGKTILMGTCIFYEFLLAKKYPKDKRFCHNALVFAPDKTVLQSLREIMIFDKTKVVPPEYARVLDSNIKFHFLDESGTVLHTIDDSDFNIIISNTQKIIIKKKRKEATPGEVLFDVTAIQKTEDRDVVLLREPKDAAYYEFSAKDDLVITNKYPGFTPDEVLKSFHADTYCFDSLPEKECFFQYIKSAKVQEVYFTGMFTSNQGDLSVYYYDPESGRIRQYYPDFLAKMKDGTYQLIEVKGDNKIDDVVVQAKKEAALEMAAASGIKYEMYAGSTIMKTHILEDPPVHQTSLLP